MRQKFIVANWKMNPNTVSRALTLARSVARHAARARGTRVILCPPTLFLLPIANALAGRKCAVGAQDVSLKEKVGPHTGEVSAGLFYGAGARYALIGHSERRALGETDEIVSWKLVNALDGGLTPIVCVGERERDAGGLYLHTLADEITHSLKNVSGARVQRIIIVYEPIWAIGKTASAALTSHDVHHSVLFVRKTLASLFSRKIAEAIPILYGGSVEPENASALVREGNADGLLVGHASLDAHTFSAIIASVGRVRERR